MILQTAPTERRTGIAQDSTHFLQRGKFHQVTVRQELLLRRSISSEGSPITGAVSTIRVSLNFRECYSCSYLRIESSLMQGIL